MVKLVCGTGTLLGLLSAAKRLLAAECCIFLSPGVEQLEQWRPYHRWGKTLRPSDAIITFNYDRVVEIAAGDSVCPIRPLRQTREDEIEAYHTDRSSLWKLHGSVDWERKGDGEAIQQSDPEFAVTCDDDAIYIATPGPSKAEMTRTLAYYWRQALIHIENASAIVFIGYRFPPSDAQARELLLAAIASNRTQHISVHIVLGDPGPSTQRLEALLRFVCAKGRHENEKPIFTNPPVRTYSLKVHPLFSQDFLSVFAREDLFPKG